MRGGSRQRRSAAAIVSALGLVLALASCSVDAGPKIDLPTQADGALPAETTAQLQDAVTHAMTAAGASGAVVGVWAPWSGSWVTGLAAEGAPAVDAAAEFRAGRVTRPMICDALYIEAARGVVALDDKVTKWVSGVPELTDTTLAQLCDGTSGIGAYSSQLMSLFLSNPSRTWNPHELASYGLGQARTTLPGEAWRDSDAGYVLLGLALERATGQSAAALLQERIFEPLQLAATSLPSGSLAASPGPGPVLKGGYLVKDEAGAWVCGEPVDISTLSLSTGFTDSGVVTDIHDLGRYAQSLASGALMAKGTTRFAQPLALIADGPSWLTTTGGAVQAGSLIGQYGAVPGYLTAAFSDPNTGMTVAVVLNNSTIGEGVAAALAWELAAIASKAPAASGKTAPEAGLPWTAEQYREQITAAAVCTAPAD